MMGLLATADALAKDEPGPPPLAPDAHIEFSARPSDGQTGREDVTGPVPEAPPEAPPSRPRHKGLVLESTLGVLGFVGEFAHVSPPAFQLRTQIGYEVLDWLMFFGEGELAFAQATESLDIGQSFAFPIWGFGGGARATFHVSPRVALFVQGQMDALTADVPHDSLTILGFRNAESLSAAFGVRAGIEWFQMDRHLALCADGGARETPSFAKVTANDTSLMWDASVGMRYTF
jgi:hypothetical protein